MVSEEDEIKSYQELVVQEAKIKDKSGITEVPIVKDNARLNFNEALSANRGNPTLGAKINKHAPSWVKGVLLILAILIIIGFVLGVILYLEVRV